MMVPPTQLIGSRCVNSPSKLRRLICDGKLLACLSFIISQDVAPRTPYGVSPFQVSPMSTIHQELSGHLRRSRGQMDLSSVVQKKGESLWKFIQHFCNQRNVISEVDSKSIIMFFKKGLRDSSLIRKLIMKNPRMSEEMLAIANKYALMEEAALNTREQNKENESGHTDQPSSSKGHGKKRKVDCFMNNVEQPCRNKEYRPRPGEFEGFLN
jgi:hypothetical protein